MKGSILRRVRLRLYRFMKALICLALVYGGMCLFVLLVSDGMIFLPQPSRYQDSSAIIKLTSGDGITISAVYLPSSQSGYTILYSHGNAEDLGNIQPVLQHLHQIGFSVFAYDYRGYGTSRGRPSERNAYKDIDSAYNYLTQQLGIPPERIIAYGRSVGGGPAVDGSLSPTPRWFNSRKLFHQCFSSGDPHPAFPF